MNIENDPTVTAIIRKAEADIKEVIGCEIHIAIDAFEIKLRNKDVLKDIVCTYYKAPWEKIISRGRPGELSDAMFVYMYIARNVLKCTLKEIADDCGKRHHATVLNAIKQVKNYISIQDHLAHDMEVIKEMFIKKRLQ
ncbi:MAG TPA: helix-turn-helix domain-containing protein [Hanamia sp.]